MKFTKLYLILFLAVSTLSCKSKYSLSNLNIGDAKSFDVNLFQNTSSFLEPNLHQDFTRALQDAIQNQTGLELVNMDGDLFYEGEIIEYRISPTTPTTKNTAAQNRLTISVKVHFINNSKINSEFDKSFTFFYDYDGKKQLTGNLKSTAHEEIFNRLTQDILLASLDDW